MGNVQSPPADPQYATASRAITKQELEDLKSLFVSLAAQSLSSTRFVSRSVFKACFGIIRGLGDPMFDLVTNQRTDGMFTFEYLSFPKSDLQTVLASMMEAIFALDSEKSGSESPLENSFKSRLADFEERICMAYRDWKLLYYSSVNGLSFHTFLASLSKFQLGRHTNGIGFGGKANHFDLFLSASLEQGYSYTCSTFDTPCLSSTNRIQPEVIECWAVVPKTCLQDGGQPELHKGTVLERFKEDRNMLKMVGLANSSE